MTITSRHLWRFLLFWDIAFLDYAAVNAFGAVGTGKWGQAVFYALLCAFFIHDINTGGR